MHGFQMDREGTDTYRFRQSGAVLSLIQSPTGIGLTLTPKEPAAIEQLIHWLELIQAWDCFLIEGYKSADFTKLVLIRSVDDLPLLSTLTHIKWVLFQQEADFQYYQGLSEYNQLKEKGVVLKPMTQSAEMIGILEDWLLRQAYKTKE
jgi:molybdopterin-guanine dinucleotide biosynthesis protein B